MSIQNRATNIVLTTILFLLIGTQLPRLASQLLPASYYWHVTSDVATDKLEYKTGDTIKITFSRTSRISANSTLVRELVRLESDPPFKQITVYQDSRPNVFLRQGEEKIHAYYDIPCGVASGRYTLVRSLVFYIDGIEKVYTYETNPFKIGGGTSCK